MTLSRVEEISRNSNGWLLIQSLGSMRCCARAWLRLSKLQSNGCARSRRTSADWSQTARRLAGWLHTCCRQALLSIFLSSAHGITHRFPRPTHLFLHMGTSHTGQITWISSPRVAPRDVISAASSGAESAPVFASSLT